jgi:hypothetical protein
MVPGEGVEDDDAYAAVVAPEILGVAAALHGDIVVEGARRQLHQPASERNQSNLAEVTE